MDKREVLPMINWYGAKI